MRDGVPYVRAGYLDSALWPAGITTDGERLQVNIGGHFWQLTPNQRETLADGQVRDFALCPVSVRGNVYLPPCIIEAITGWHVEYVKEGNTVYIYSHFEGEEPPKLP